MRVNRSIMNDKLMQKILRKTQFGGIKKWHIYFNLLKAFMMIKNDLRRTCESSINEFSQRLANCICFFFPVIICSWIVWQAWYYMWISNYCYMNIKAFLHIFIYKKKRNTHDWQNFPNIFLIFQKSTISHLLFWVSIIRKCVCTFISFLHRDYFM